MPVEEQLRHRILVSGGRRAPAELLVAAGILMLAFGARLAATLKGSGLDGIIYYDEGVNFAAAFGLGHGRMPYRDFLFLHPPGIVVALAPFAALASLTSDGGAFMVARLCFMLVGALNAVLVARFLLPCGKAAAVLGGVLYAVFWPAIYSERTVMLQVLANTCLLVALIAISPAESAPTRRRFVLAGVLLGFGVVIKVWGFLPVLILLGWVLTRFDARRAGLLLVGATASATVVCLPFFLAAPGRMWQMVVRDQLLRVPSNSSAIERLTDILGLGHLPLRVTPLLVIALAAALAGVVLAWQQEQARPAVLLLASMVTMLLLTPTWFAHYAALTAPVLAITAGAAGQQLLNLVAERRWPPLRVGAVALLVIAPLIAALPLALADVGERFPRRPLTAALASGAGCTTSDYTTALILTDVLSRNLRRGCPLVVDLGGVSHHMAASGGSRLSRGRNAAFQEYVLAYLASGDRTMVIRFERNAGLSDSTADAIEAWPVVASWGRFVVRAPQT
ncbi:MAG TPA: glycosyltransferase 87 family protein [Propionibacteriaceae bacterium]|nr:glycosyltransferase 87 family protein [Propionibacteriaceae bacterium]